MWGSEYILIFFILIIVVNVVRIAVNRKKKPLPGQIIPLVMILIAFGSLYYFILGPDFTQKHLIKNGLPGRATIIDIGTTGVIVNDQPRVKLLLEVEPENGAKYETEIRMVISPVYLPQFQPGAKLKVRIDPKDDKKVAVEDIIKERR